MDFNYFWYQLICFSKYFPYHFNKKRKNHQLTVYKADINLV